MSTRENVLLQRTTKAPCHSFPPCQHKERIISRTSIHEKVGMSNGVKCGYECQGDRQQYEERSTDVFGRQSPATRQGLTTPSIHPRRRRRGRLRRRTRWRLGRVARMLVMVVVLGWVVWIPILPAAVGIGRPSGMPWRRRSGVSVVNATVVKLFVRGRQVRPAVVERSSRCRGSARTPSFRMDELRQKRGKG